jgi:RNA polymerase sigma-54 factor
MRKGLGHHQKTSVTTALKVDPRTLLLSQLIQLSVHELEQIVESELLANPALAKIDDSGPEQTEEDVLKAVAPQELRPSGDARELWRSLPQDAEERDWLDLARVHDSLSDKLRGQMAIKVSGKDRKIADYLIGSLNDRGYLTCPVEEAALDCGCSLEEAERVLELLKQCEPAGVGAADLRECLLLQLRSAETDAERLARLILKNDWARLVQRDVKGLRRKYRVGADLVRQALAVITSLDPFPGESHAAQSRNGALASVTMVPDIVLDRTEQGWCVTVNGVSPGSLRIDRSYDQWRRRPGQPDREEAKHVSEHVGRARRFIEAVESRRNLLLEIGSYLVNQQSGFVSTGDPKFLVPMTRTKMASDLGKHESTVSRATSGKFVQIATGEVVPCDLFFRPALKIQRMIEEILSTENPGNPLSDESIAKILHEKGVKIARRTVNKYRDKQRLLSSHKRRSA